MMTSRGWFLVFTLSVAINCSITIFFACYCIAIEGWRLLYVIGLIEALIFCGLGWLLSGFTVSPFQFVLMINLGKKNVLAFVCGNEPDLQRNVQLQKIQLPEERQR